MTPPLPPVPEAVREAIQRYGNAVVLQDGTVHDAWAALDLRIREALVEAYEQAAQVAVSVWNEATALPDDSYSEGREDAAAIIEQRIRVLAEARQAERRET